MDLKMIDNVDDYKDFLTVEELNKTLKYFSKKGSVELIQISESEKGLPIFCAKLGNGNKNALIFGFPHPNEPIGSLTCISLIKFLNQNEEMKRKFTWYIIPCADPDGAKLNEGWFKGEFTIKKYAYNYYRSKAPLQTDWTFPINFKDYVFDKPPKNTQALISLINEIKPDLIYPIHNAGFSGAYFFLTRPMPESFYDEVISLCKSLSIPLDMGEPEMEFMQEFRKPFYKEVTAEDYYEYYTKAGKFPEREAGTSSIGYAMKLNPNLFGLTAEISYIYDPKIEDQTPTHKTRRENLEQAIKESREILKFIEKILAVKDLNKNFVFYDLFQYIRKRYKLDLEVAEKNLEKEKYKKFATVSQEFTTLVKPKFSKSLILGELRRLLLESEKTKEIEKLINEVERKIDELNDFVNQNSNYKVFPIKKLVQFQLGFLLIALKHL